MRGNVQTFTDLHGGVNARDADFELQPNEARDARNVIGRTSGGLQTRAGCETLEDASPFTASTVFAFQDWNPGPRPIVLGAGGGEIFSLLPNVTSLHGSAGFDYWAMTVGPKTGAASPTVYMMNGVDTPQVYVTGGGSSSDWTATTGTVPNCPFLVFFNDQFFAAGNFASFGKQSTLYASNLADALDWDPAVAGTSAYELSLEEGGRDYITGLGTLGAYLLVFKRSGVRVVTDTVTGANRALATAVGTLYPRSIAETPAGLVYLGTDGRVWITDASTTRAISQPIDPVLTGRRDTGWPLLAFDHRPTGVYFNNRYYLSIPTAGDANDLTVDYDFETGAWWLHDFAATDWAADEPLGAGRVGLYGMRPGTTTLSSAFSSDDGLDNGVAFTAYWKGPHNVFGSADTRKRVRQVRLTGTGDDVTFKLAKDYAPVATAVKTAGFVGAGTAGRVILPTPGVARAWSLELEATVPFGLDAQTWAFTQRTD
jgi:hypothetical protein